MTREQLIELRWLLKTWGKENQEEGWEEEAEHMICKIDEEINDKEY